MDLFILPIFDIVDVNAYLLIFHPNPDEPEKIATKAPRHKQF
jgi:hypothetical protein